MASVDFVQGAFLKLSVNSDLSFELKQEQRIAVNCLMGRRDVFAVMPTGLGKSFIFHSDRTEDDFGRKASEQCNFSYLPVVRPD